MQIQVSGQHRVLGVPAIPALAAIFPQARKVTWAGSQHMLLPHGYQETRLLRNMGFEVPAPVLTQYDWNGGKPFDVQRKTVALMTTSQRAYVLNDMGTGKTRCALWAYDFLRKAGQANKLLVAATLSTLNFTWAREVFTAFPHLSVGILHGDKKKRLKVLAEDHDVYVINHDGVAVIFKELMARGDIDTLVIDELAVLRSGESDRNKTFRKLAAKMTWAWGLTGSPIPNDPTDAWGQCAILTPHTVPKRLGAFRSRVMVKVSQFKYVPAKDAVDHVYEVMQPAVRYDISDVVELPEKIERTQDVGLGPKQAKIYEAMRNHAHAQVGAGQITAANAGVVLNKLLQLSLGYVYDQDRKVISLDNDERLDAIVDIVRASKNKVLVFVPFTHALFGIRDRLAKEGIDVELVWGDVAQGERDRIFNLFQNTSKIRVILAHPMCMAHGITLTAADTVVWAGPPTSLEIFEQANRRITRIGQKMKQLILMLQSTAAERRIYARLRQKQQVQDNLLALFADGSE